MNELTFNTIRELYKNLRMLEAYKIKNYLDTCPKLNVIETKIYQGKFGCDNWLGVDVVIETNVGKKAFFISLQAFGKGVHKYCGNHEYCNYYAVMDRIGIYKYTNQQMIDDYLKGKGKLETIDALERMDPTDISLPIDSEKFKQLIELLK